MKSEKGITLISVTIYVIVMTVMVALIAVISSFFYKNTKNIRDVSPIAEYTKFNSFFSKEANQKGLKIIHCENSEINGSNYITFNNGVQYTFIEQNKSIYRNKVKICRNIVQCEFEQGTNANGVSTVTIKIKAENDTEDKAPITYTLKE